MPGMDESQNGGAAVRSTHGWALPPAWRRVSPSAWMIEEQRCSGEVMAAERW